MHELPVPGVYLLRLSTEQGISIGNQVNSSPHEQSACTRQAFTIARSSRHAGGPKTSPIGQEDHVGPLGVTAEVWHATGMHPFVSGVKCGVRTAGDIDTMTCDGGVLFI